MCTIVPLVSWAYVNVARALRMLIHAALATIDVWCAIAEADFTVKRAANRVSTDSVSFYQQKKFNFSFLTI